MKKTHSHYHTLFVIYELNIQVKNELYVSLCMPIISLKSHTQIEFKSLKILLKDIIRGQEQELLMPNFGYV